MSARTVATSKRLDLWQNARLFALLNMALADGYVATFDTKYHAYNYWRPVTAIRAADTDGNDDTEADTTWTPLLVTPPFPSYTSAHSTVSAAAVRVAAGRVPIVAGCGTNDTRTTIAAAERADR